MVLQSIDDVRLDAQLSQDRRDRVPQVVWRFLLPGITHVPSPECFSASRDSIVEYLVSGR